jgi:hypothetical protein
MANMAMSLSTKNIEKHGENESHGQHAQHCQALYPGEKRAS